ncbi:TnsD family Tn7-like transposition protein [Roseateles sp.]|uniref:TnsD family Tn7-like transposition protein n=1 Tax=Roseateles sp. TaxID=1971397 RepID=UPI0035A10580
MRLPAFPIPYEGETVSSVVARFLGRTAGPTERKLQLLGLGRTASTAVMPMDLQALVDAMPLGHPWCNSPELVLMRHTPVPLYLYFAHPQRAASSLQSLLGGLCGNPAAALGLTVSAARSLARQSKFCAQCVETDIATRGNAVSYREHQPEFVKVCATHGTPLLLSCSMCSGERKAARMWRTAGTCHCDTPSFPPAMELGQDAVGEDGWLWLSRQVKSILSTSQLPTTPLLPMLRRSLKAGGYGSLGGIDSSAVLEGLESRFGATLLNKVGALAPQGRMLSTRWPARILGEPALAEQRLPDALRTLLLTALVATDIADLADAPATVEPAPEPQPLGYSSERRLDRGLLSRDSIEQVLDSAGGKMTVAAGQLGVAPAVLAVDMRRLGIRLPLPEATLRRLGSAKVESVRAALRSGEAKKKIQTRLGVSEWSIQLIQLDDLGLAGRHRAATIEAQRHKHRETLTTYIAAHPEAGKNDVRSACVSATDWLGTFDGEWLAENLPKRKAAAPSRRTPVRDWRKLDHAFSIAIGAAARSELATSARPVRLTVSMLLKRCSATAAQDPNRKHHLPLTLAAAHAHAESDDSFYKRKLAWALSEYRALHVPISTNMLRRVAGLSPLRLMEQRQFIIEEATRLKISIDARCFLSPLG